MPSHLFDGSIEDHGRWTQYTEKKFLILENTFLLHSEGHVPPVARQPRNRQAWKSKLRGTIEIRKALLCIDEMVQNMF